LPDDDSLPDGGHLQRDGGSGGENGMMRRTSLTVAALLFVFTIAALIVLSALTMGAIAGA
jgi:hypothetical protein